MSDRKALTDAEVQAEIDSDALTDWAVVDGKLSKTFKFKNFAAALGWMVSVGVAADKMNHHPEWSNVYNRVTVNLVTHDLDNSISTLDVALAKKMDQAAG